MLSAKKFNLQEHYVQVRRSFLKIWQKDLEDFQNGKINLTNLGISMKNLNNIDYQILSSLNITLEEKKYIFENTI